VVSAAGKNRGKAEAETAGKREGEAVAEGVTKAEAEGKAAGTGEGAAAAEGETKAEAEGKGKAQARGEGTGEGEGEGGTTKPPFCRLQRSYCNFTTPPHSSTTPARPQAKVLQGGRTTILGYSLPSHEGKDRRQTTTWGVTRSTPRGINHGK
jgi:hypothetical protein